MAKRPMLNLKAILWIVVVTVIFGALMGYRSGLAFAWQRALLAALAFGLLGWLIVTMSAWRR